MHSLCMFGEHPRRSAPPAPPRPAPPAVLTHLSPCKRARTGPRAPAHPATPSYTHQLNQVPPPSLRRPPASPGTPLVSLLLACAHARARTHSPRPRTGRGRRPPGAGSQEQSRGSIPRLASARKLRAGRGFQNETVGVGNNLLLFLHLETLILPRAPPPPAPKNRPEE